ncbi:tyrosine-type recombinase/integrase [Conexibacter sp. W3-3-2]|uniref:tyrosine-type recombinase/integrase n=1 Tax=Conexibacter sp. W3-3-2 TaxID=2675227 RepID=UPI0018AC26BC|nr:tyrosine-type recombinase/integrase [Conexibacter sp. W3-3-2]
MSSRDPSRDHERPRAPRRRRGPRRTGGGGDLLQAALGVAAEQAAPNTRRAYAAAYRQLADFAAARAGGQPVTAAAVDRDLVVAFRDDLARRGLSSSTLSSRMAAIRRLADALELDPRIQRVKTIKAGEEAPVRALSLAEYDGLLRIPDRRTTAGLRDVAILALMGDAGLRRAEVTRLNVEDITEHARHRAGARDAIAPTRSQTRYAVVVRQAKGGKTRTVPLSKQALEAVAAWFKRRPASSEEDLVGAPLFVTLTRNRPAQRMQPDAIAELTAKHATTARLPDDLRHPHVLRHTFCTQLAERDVPVELIRDLAGHADVRTTLKYVTLTDARRADAIRDGFERGRVALERL